MWMLLGAIALLAACGGSAGTATTTTGAALTDSATAAAVAAIRPNRRPPRTPAREPAMLPSTRQPWQGRRPMLREAYTYQGTSRDPFKSVLVVAQRGPELPDLKLDCDHLRLALAVEQPGDLSGNRQ